MAEWLARWFLDLQSQCSSYPDSTTWTTVNNLDSLSKLFTSYTQVFHVVGINNFRSAAAEG